jgi:hypothetical protein
MTMATRNRHTHAVSWQGLVPNHEFSCISFTMEDETDLNAEHVLYRVWKVVLLVFLPVWVVWLIMSRIAMRTSSVMVILWSLLNSTLMSSKGGFRLESTAIFISFYSLIDPSLYLQSVLLASKRLRRWKGNDHFWADSAGYVGVHTVLLIIKNS